MTRIPRNVVTLALAVAVSLPLAAANAQTGIVNCSQLEEKSDHRLRHLVSKNAATLTTDDNEILFLAIQPDSATATAKHAIVFFNGTSGIMTDWPFHMIQKSDLGSESLCADTTLVFFDYPGIGGTTFNADTFTFDAFARIVDSLVTHLNGELDTKIEVVHPLGWSLGALAALKYAALAGGNGDLAIGNVFLIAAKAGGDVTSTQQTALNDRATGHQALCVTQVTCALGQQDNYVAAIKETMFGLTFPYYDDSGTAQSAYTGSSDTICEAANLPDPGTGDECVTTTIDSVTLRKDGTTPIQTACQAGEAGCPAAAVEYGLNRLAHPYATCQGLCFDVYVQQRKIVNDWNFSHCQQAGTEWSSEKCTANPNFSLTDATANSGVCATVVPDGQPQNPTSSSCMSLEHIQGQLIVMNGLRDMFIQPIYGEALVDAYEGDAPSAVYQPYSEKPAGHAVLITAPVWVNGIVADAMKTSISKPAAFSKSP